MKTQSDSRRLLKQKSETYESCPKNCFAKFALIIQIWRERKLLSKHFSAWETAFLTRKKWKDLIKIWLVRGVISNMGCGKILADNFTVSSAWYEGIVQGFNRLLAVLDFTGRQSISQLFLILKTQIRNLSRAKSALGSNLQIARFFLKAE